jgi:hypothetical protein
MLEKHGERLELMGQFKLVLQFDSHILGRGMVDRLYCKVEQ